MNKIEKINLSIGTPVVVATKAGAQHGYYLGNGVVGYMNLPYRRDELFFVPFLNIYDDGVVGVCPFNMVSIEKTPDANGEYWTSYYPKKEYGDWGDFTTDKVVDTDDLENCQYARDEQYWWNDAQKDAIKRMYKK